MCGITGIISRDILAPETEELVASMNSMLEHRGPDGDGAFHDQHVCMAMRRLSIIGLTSGWQPLYNEDRSIALIANGEIYNYVELREALMGRGHEFATGSDCETIVHLYEEYGDNCVDHLRGMFAFALWDGRRRRLLLARDRMGEKPLYLVERPDSITFCSELRAMVGAGVVKPTLDPFAVHEYFHYGYVPEPRCPLQGVRKLPAGHVLTINVDPWRVEERCYWRMEDAPPIDGDPATLIREELERISEIIIRSEVPVGIALSGGLDSSIIAVLAQKNYPGTMQAITIGYEGSPWQDERVLARELSTHLHMPIHEIELSTSGIVSAFPSVVVDRDEPIADMAGAGYWNVMKRAHELNLRVMLAGQGGDELFWGYKWVRDAAVATRRKNLLLQGGGAAPGLRDYIALSRPPLSYSGGLRWLKSFGGLRTGLRQWRADQRSDPNQIVFSALDPTFCEAMHLVARMYTRDFAEEINGCHPAMMDTIAPPWPNIDVAIMSRIAQTYLRQNGIAQGDRLSMAWSVELRLPLVDYRLAELVVGLTKTQPSVAGSPKQWLRAAVADIMPQFVMQRRKRGFSPPWRQWARSIAAVHGSALNQGYLTTNNILSEDGAKQMRNMLAPTAISSGSWLAERALVLEMWCREMASLAIKPQRPTGATVRAGAAA